MKNQYTIIKIFVTNIYTNILLFKKQIIIIIKKTCEESSNCNTIGFFLFVFNITPRYEKNIKVKLKMIKKIWKY